MPAAMTQLQNLAIFLDLKGRGLCCQLFIQGGWPQESSLTALMLGENQVQR